MIYPPLKVTSPAPIKVPCSIRLSLLVLAASGLLAARGSAAAAEPMLARFQRDIQPVLATYCYDCHGNGHDKGGVTLDGFENDAALRDPTLWLKALKNVRSGVMPPAAEEHPLPGPEAEKLIAWIKRDAFGLDPAKPDPGRVTVRRLNRVEYRNTVRDLMGVDYDTQKEFPADDTGHGFDNIADVLTISPMLLEKYLDAAQAIVAKGVVTQPRMVAEQGIPGRAFATVKVDTTIPERPSPAAPAETSSATAPLLPDIPRAPGASGSPGAPPAPPAPGATGVNGASLASVASPAQGTAGTASPSPAGAAASDPAAGKGPRRAPGAGRGRGGPPPVTRPAPTVEGDTLVLSYYTPAVVAAQHRVEHAGKYQLAFDFLAQETYAEDLFDLNKCQVVVTVDGQTLLDQPFVREGYGKKYEYVFDREWAAGQHELAIEIKPLGPETPQYRKLRLRLNAVSVRGPFAPERWVKTPGYEKFFPREVPVGEVERRAYAREILGKFAPRALRRPVEAVTIDRLVALAESVYAQPQNSFEAGVAQSVAALLASPSFIFCEDYPERLQPGQLHPAVDEYSLASRLSYFLWSSTPDDELLRLARDGTLRKNLPAQLQRMLGDARANELVRNFTGQWLQARDIATVAITPAEVFLRDHPNPAYEEARETMSRLQGKPPGQRTPEEGAAAAKARGALFEFARQTKPDLTDALRRAMLQETEMTFAYILKEDRSLLELLESDYTFLNEPLAAHYGIEGVTGTTLRKVTLPPESPRGGVLTQGTVLAVTSNPTRTSPVKRGVFILDAILGMPPAPPPPNIPSLEDAAPAAKLRTMSLRETLALHASNPACASCHSRMDPLGLALENFNAMGMWRTADMNQPVQTSGKLITGESFANIRELKHVLATAKRRDFYHCLSEKLLTYALGRSIEYYDTATLDLLVDQLEAAGGRPSALLQGIVNSVPFQQRRQPAVAALTRDDLNVPDRPAESLAQVRP